MTTREFLNTVIEANLSEEMTNQAKAMVAALDKRNAKRAATPSKTAVANEPIKADIVATLNSEPKTAAEVGATLNLTTMKASALLQQLAKSGKVAVHDVKVKGKGTCKGYTIITQ